MSDKNLSPYAEKHSCPLCSFEYRRQVEERYIDWEDEGYLARQYELRPKDLRRHIIAFNLETKRSENTAGFYRSLIRVAAPYILSNPDKITEAILTTAMKQLDKIEGREQKARKNDADVDRDQLKNAIMSRMMETALREQVPPEVMQQAMKHLGVAVENAELRPTPIRKIGRAHV